MKVGDTASPFDPPPQVLAIVDRQNEKIILRRQRRHGPAAKVVHRALRHNPA